MVSWCPLGWEAGLPWALRGDTVWGQRPEPGKGTPCVTLGFDSSAITALPSQLSVKKLWLLQGAISKAVHATGIKEQSFPLSPLWARVTPPVCPQRAGAKLGPATRFKSLSAISYKSFIERKFAEMPRWCFPAVCTQCIILPDCLSFPQDRHIHVYISKII